LCDSIALLDRTRPIAVNSGDTLIRVQHRWPLSRCWEYEFDYHVLDYVPVKKPPFHFAPAWAFEEENLVSVTARMALAYLCNRGLLNPDGRGTKSLSVTASCRDIGQALEVPESIARRALVELEELEILRIERPGAGAKERAIYCNGINFVEEPERWARIKSAQAESGTVKVHARKVYACL